MKIILNKKNLKEFINNEKNIGFVPTMGSIHVGHAALIKKSINQCNKTVVSIFVNKPQFNKKSDFRKYPVNIKKDLNILKKLKVDFVYLPKLKQIYPKGPNKKLKISSFAKALCGKCRPGHFKAVVDVIDRFINIINPKKIYLGEKDMQQLKIIENFILEKYPNIKVIPCKIIREKNGIAYSSRNLNLSRKEKRIASAIYKIIKKEKVNLIKKKVLTSFISKKIINTGATKIEYLEVLDINKLIKPFKRKTLYKVFVAYYLNLTRLIDNI
jgi:pantoate--beta-alanine ligase